MQWAFVQLIAEYPNIIEKYYSKGLYTYISEFLRVIFGWVPFSLGDILYTIIGLIIIKGIFKTLKERKINLKNTFLKTGAIVSIFYFLFHFNWALNYFRTPLFKILNFEKVDYVPNELVDFTKMLIIKTNQVQFSITKNDSIIVENPLNRSQIKETSLLAYKELELKHPQFKIEQSSIKHSLFSIPLTYMGFAGYLNPITNEAQVNSLIPKNNYPSTLCHEIAHQVGIAAESEANFVGYLAAIHSKDTYYNYSGYLTALRYCLFDIYRANPEEFELLKKDINKGILKDMQQSRDFWESYQNWSEKYFKKFYDSFLKVNKQKDGIKGYNKMVSLLMSYYKTEKL